MLGAVARCFAHRWPEIPGERFEYLFPMPGIIALPEGSPSEYTLRSNLYNGRAVLFNEASAKHPESGDVGPYLRVLARNAAESLGVPELEGRSKMSRRRVSHPTVF